MIVIGIKFRARIEMRMMHMKLPQAVLRTLAVAALPLLWCATASAGAGVPELDPGTATGGIALVAVAAVLLVERYRSR
jgi:hypothetical protein